MLVLQNKGNHALTEVTSPRGGLLVLGGRFFLFFPFFLLDLDDKKQNVTRCVLRLHSQALQGLSLLGSMFIVDWMTNVTLYLSPNSHSSFTCQSQTQ